MLSRTTIDSPIGGLTLVADDTSLLAVLWPDDPPGRVGFASEAIPVDTGVHPVLALAAAQLEEYFDGRRTDFDLPVSAGGTPFQQAAWHVLTTIPFAATITYGEQASRLGSPRAVRAVGAANGRNPLSIVVPCHRVVGADGRLTGFAAGLDTKAWLLAHERRIAGVGPE